MSSSRIDAWKSSSRRTDKRQRVIASRAEIGGVEVARHYDRLDRYYREIWGEQIHHGFWRTGQETLEEARESLTECIADEAALTTADRVCDIGCGYGASARFLARRRGAEVTGVTISPAQYDAAIQASTQPADPRYVLADWLSNDLPAGSFSAAVAIESVEHMSDKAGCFRQAARVLQEGGRLVVSGWLVPEAATDLQRRWLIEPICRGARMPNLGSEADYRRFAEGAGLRVVRFQDITFAVRRTWPALVTRLLVRLFQHPSDLVPLCHDARRNLTFALTFARIFLAFRTRALRYGVFTLRKAGA